MSYVDVSLEFHDNSERPISNLKISLSGVSGHEYTDSDGCVTFNSVTVDNTYTVYVDGDEFDEIEVTEDDTEFEFTMNNDDNDVLVVLTFVDDEGEPISGLSVDLYKKYGVTDGFFGAQYTDDDGEVTFSDVKTYNTYIVYVDGDEFDEIVVDSEDVEEDYTYDGN